MRKPRKETEKKSHPSLLRRHRKETGGTIACRRLPPPLLPFSPTATKGHRGASRRQVVLPVGGTVGRAVLGPLRGGSWFGAMRCVASGVSYIQFTSFYKSRRSTCAELIFR